MGLDMYAFSTKAKLKKEVDFDTINVETEEVHYWRKHPNLHGWMQSLYESKGGTSDSFNGDCVVLTESDLDLEDQHLPFEVERDISTLQYLRRPFEKR